MRVTISFAPFERTAADAVKAFLLSRFPGGKMKEAKTVNSHGHYMAYYSFHRTKHS